jgi:hypothetical protein
LTLTGRTERWVCLVIALCPHTPKHIRDSWSHYTDISKPVDGNGAQNMVTVQSEFKPPATFWSLAHELTYCSNRAQERWVSELSREGWFIWHFCLLMNVGHKPLFKDSHICFIIHSLPLISNLRMLREKRKRWKFRLVVIYC